MPERALRIALALSRAPSFAPLAGRYIETTNINYHDALCHACIIDLIKSRNTLICCLCLGDAKLFDEDFGGRRVFDDYRALCWACQQKYSEWKYRTGINDPDAWLARLLITKPGWLKSGHQKDYPPFDGKYGGISYFLAKSHFHSWRDRIESKIRFDFLMYGIRRDGRKNYRKRAAWNKSR